MTIEKVRQDFQDRLNSRPAGDRYLDRQWERSILRDALSQGVTVDIARQALMELCQDQGFLLESTVLRDARHRLSVRAAGNRPIDEREFNDVTKFIREKLGERIQQGEIHRMLCEIIEDNQFPINRGVFGRDDWFERVKEVAGVV